MALERSTQLSASYPGKHYFIHYFINAWLRFGLQGEKWGVSMDPSAVMIPWNTLALSWFPRVIPWLVGLYLASQFYLCPVEVL